MLFTEPHNQFKATLERADRGAPLNLEPGYAEAYQTWSQKNAAILYKLSAEERTQAFSDALEEQHSAVSPRADLLQVSEDGGKHFDQWLTVDQAEKKDPLKLRLLSPTLRSTTTDFAEVKREQQFLHTLKKLRDAAFSIVNAAIQEEQIKIRARHPRRGDYTVSVDLDENPTQPLQYRFANEAGEVQMPETQLPEEYGLAAPLETFSLGNLAEKSAKTTVLSAAGLALLQKQKNDMAAARTFMAAQWAQQKAQHAHPQPYLSNVMASKNAMKARFARQDKEQKAALSRALDREKQAQSALLARKQAQKKAAEAAEANPESTSSSFSVKQKAAAAAGVGMSLLAAAGAGTVLTIHLGTLS